jgi:RNA polymerase sigma-70 factor (ECF subfamily)
LSQIPAFPGLYRLMGAIERREYRNQDRVKPPDSATPPVTDAGSRLPNDIFEQHRTLLLSIAYRMLGSLADAEDIVQETFIRWQQASGIESPRAFLVTIVSRLCINQLESARVRREQYIGPWLPEPLITSPRQGPEGILLAEDSLSMAFLLLLERLSPVERAVFLLREVFDYEFREIAPMVGLKEPACRQTLRRARQRLVQARPRFQASREQQEELFQRFLEASSRGDMDGLIALLHEDVVLYADGGGKTAAVPRPVTGVQNVARFMLRAPRKLLPRDIVKRMANVNGRPAIVSYLSGFPHSVFTVEVDGEKIRSIYIVANPDKLARLPLLPAPPC